MRQWLRIGEIPRLTRRPAAGGDGLATATPASTTPPAKAMALPPPARDAGVGNDVAIALPDRPTRRRSRSSLPPRTGVHGCEAHLCAREHLRCGAGGAALAAEAGKGAGHRRVRERGRLEPGKRLPPASRKPPRCVAEEHLLVRRFIDQRRWPRSRRARYGDIACRRPAAARLESAHCGRTAPHHGRCPWRLQAALQPGLNRSVTASTPAWSRARTLIRAPRA